MKSAPHPSMSWLVVYTSECSRGHTERKTLSRDAAPPVFGPCQKCKWVGAKAKKGEITAGDAVAEIVLKREAKRCTNKRASTGKKRACKRCSDLEEGLSQLAKVLANLLLGAA